MRLAALLILAACGGCPPQPIPTPTKLDMAPRDYGMVTCPTTVTVSPSDVCDGMFTSSGLACAHCTGAVGCLDAIDVVYCVTGNAGCLDDNACVTVTDGSDGSPQARETLRPIKKIKPRLRRPQ